LFLLLFYYFKGNLKSEDQFFNTNVKKKIQFQILSIYRMLADQHYYDFIGNNLLQQNFKLSLAFVQNNNPNNEFIDNWVKEILKILGRHEKCEFEKKEIKIKFETLLKEKEKSLGQINYQNWIFSQNISEVCNKKGCYANGNNK